MFLCHLRDQSYFDQLSVTFKSGSAVSGINLDEKWVNLASGEKINYEKLLLATGADAAIPSFYGIDNVPYQVVRTLEDALMLRKSFQNAKSAIVIGAGLQIEVGNTVNVEKATWTNTIGDPELISVWSDPDFDPDQRAFYYARVIEIPTPRWTAYEAVRFGIKMPEDCKMDTQERAYTSPIWYTPN